MKTSPLICYVNQWTGFYIIVTSVMKELKRQKTRSLLMFSRGKEIEN